MKIAPDALDDIVAHAAVSAPAECCGLLIGSSDTIVRAFRARNLSDNPSRYEIDPRDHLAARREARTAGLQIVGFYHSHPHSPPQPSPTDVAEAFDHESLYLIVGSEAGEWRARLFTLAATHATEIELLRSG